MNTRGPTPPQNQAQLTNQDPNAEAAMQTAVELVNTQKRLGLSLKIHDKNLHKISGKFNSMADLLRNPDFIAHLSQELYISNDSETTWFKLKVKNGKLTSITFMLTLQVHWVKAYNKGNEGFDVIVVGFSPCEEKQATAISCVPCKDFTPERITQHFQELIGETANDIKEVGKLICYIISKYTREPKTDSLEYYGAIQGFSKNKDGKIRFSPPRALRDEVRPYLPAKMLSRQYPGSTKWGVDKDWTPKLSPLFTGKKKLQILLLYRLGSWHSSFFAEKAVNLDNILQVKPTSEIPVALLVALLKNTRYDSLDAPPVGSNIKLLKFDLETINDGMVIAIDVFAADQLKKQRRDMTFLSTTQTVLQEIVKL